MSVARKRKTQNTIKESVVMIRTAQQDKNLIEKAADYLGLTISSFMLQNSIRAARKELADLERTSLTQRDAEIFLSALTKPPGPNAVLKKAFNDYDKQSRK